MRRKWFALSVFAVIIILTPNNIESSDNYTEVEVNELSHELAMFSHLRGQMTHHETMLRAHIMSKLSMSIPIPEQPQTSIGNKTEVWLYISVNHICGVDEKTETLSLSGWLSYFWNDDRLKWDPSKYGGLTKITIPEHLIWKPTLFLYNSASFSELFSTFTAEPVILLSTGFTIWPTAFTMKVICGLDLQRFPYDEHHCYAELGNWYSSSSSFDLSINTNQSYYHFSDFYGDVHNEWELMNSYMESHLIHPDLYVEWRTIRLYFDLRRRSPYYQLMLVVPSVTTMLLTLLLFWIPVTCFSLKYIASSFNILVLTILVCHIYWVVPRSGSSSPAILLYTSNTLALCGVYHFLSVFILHLSERKKSPVPSILQQYLNGSLGVILCLRSPPAKISVDAQLMSPDSVQVEMKESNQNKMRTDLIGWMEVAVAIDRILFIVFTFTFFVVLIIAFA